MTTPHLTPRQQTSLPTEQARSIFESLDLAWSLLRSFPKELLKKITKKQLEAWYSRRAAAKQAGASDLVSGDAKEEE